MKSIAELLATIMSIPHVDIDTRERARHLRWQLSGGPRALGSIFGWR